MRAGLASDEYGTEVGQLNQTHVGSAFGVNLEDGETVYGRIAALRIGPNRVVVHLAGVAGDDDSTALKLHPSVKLYFSHYDHNSQVTGTLDRIEKAVTDQASRGR
ncbi:hypothetical protein N1028_15410 [Herbiconiux sp. CPCC 203407]|uniref:Uncharacterized protein n=1 Tax=Herbiconiux oxytropis TaxID=2970915 RepID=A0AA42BUU5_9MICO|nr:hypothetical protein [Herbiconiux oxytropis]MCS5722321.1 hypothetical protein [Herbiconiux oxytropis]MCS5727282.1 hypothetical protein [Herbiconiux oxytropis]